ncbi:MAG TPA: GDSL-type esterase/lipase family protein [Myxococcota bacterium]|nr:GDSL-type esterase/lipase family protein [Myxococcota bacterium]
MPLAAKLACALALLAPFAPLPARSVPTTTPVKVMAIGDSLTVGIGSSRGGGYRAPFWEHMRDAGIEVDMVGGKVDGPETFDNRHQGYAQMPLHELSAGVFDKVRSYEPDFVLLLAGSDEVGTSHFSPHAFAANLDVMIDRVFTAKSDVKLLIATLPPAKFGKKQGAKRAVNELLRRTVRERAARGQAVYLVDAFAAIDPQREMADAAHPNDAGYERIGESFADVLLPLLGVERIE